MTSVFSIPHYASCCSSHKHIDIISCGFQVSYAIGVADPLSLTVFHFGTSSKTEQELLKIVEDNFDLKPGKIVQ